MCLSPSIFSVKESLVSMSRCVLSRYSAFIPSPPAIKQKLHLNDSFFLPKASVTGCYLLDLQSACCLREWLAVFLFLFSFVFMSVFSPGFPDCLSTCLYIRQSLFLSAPKIDFFFFFPSHRSLNWKFCHCHYPPPRLLIKTLKEFRGKTPNVAPTNNR